jgi:transposase
MAQCEVKRLKFIEETATHTAMTRRYGRAAPGERVTDSVPRNYGARTSVLSCVGWKGVEATLTVEGAVDTLVFHASVAQVLRPDLQAGAVRVRDNLRAHKARTLEEVAAARGARVLWLPPDSPDYSPIEQRWAKGKDALRAAKARTHDALARAFTEALESVSASDIRGWFQHCGYKVAPI